MTKVPTIKCHESEIYQTDMVLGRRNRTQIIVTTTLCGTWSEASDMRSKHAHRSKFAYTFEPTQTGIQTKDSGVYGTRWKQRPQFFYMQPSVKKESVHDETAHLRILPQAKNKYNNVKYNKVSNYTYEHRGSSPFRSTLNTGYMTTLDMCEARTEAVHSVALWTRVTLQLWTCVKYVPKQSIP